MKIMTVIGTRPQYIKIKPWYDYCKQNNVNNIVVDTQQHYTPNVSKNFIDEFKLNIDYKLDVPNISPVNFISEAMNKIEKIISKESPDFVLVMGDTNSTLAASLTSNKLGVKLGHIEAGIRGGYRNQPEEINRILVDDLSDFHFLSREKDGINVDNPFYIGDLKYLLLNQLENNRMFNIEYQDWFLMTIHRQENMDLYKLNLLFDFCKDLKKTIIFPMHHSIRAIIGRFSIPMPVNIRVVEPMNFGDMIKHLCKCKGIITDSGGVTKISPYFGKKCILPTTSVEWKEIIENGYGTTELDLEWLNNYSIKRDRDFYYKKDCCQIIWETLSGIFKLK